MDKKPKKAMKDYGFRLVGFYLKEEEYEALRKYCFDTRISHSQFVSGLVTDKLRREEYLKNEAKA